MLILFTDEVGSDGVSDLSQKLADDNIKEEVQEQTPAESESLSASKAEDDKVGAPPEKNNIVTNSNGQTSFPSPNENAAKGLVLYFSHSF